MSPLEAKIFANFINNAVSNYEKSFGITVSLIPGDEIEEPAIEALDESR
jgi:hypothetical protein